jgi:endonuclease/exonuclease/phosphatase family metal-dependent hydrolase
MTIKAKFIGILGTWVVLASAAFSQAVEAKIDEPLRLRVLSYNIHHGEGVDRKIDLPRIAEVIKSVSPDLVALQEVDRGVQRSKGSDEPQELAKLTGMHVVFGNNIRYQGGDYGNAVLSRFPIKRQENHPLPSFYDGEQRGVMEVEIEARAAGQGVLFLATHLDYRPDDAERLASVKFINELAASRKGLPSLLAGDLNATPDSRTLSQLKTLWTCANEETLPTFPAAEPLRQIDFILFHPAGRWKAVEVRVLNEPVASDHRALFAVLELAADSSD